jgi:hypothetical protein
MPSLAGDLTNVEASARSVLATLSTVAQATVEVDEEQEHRLGGRLDECETATGADRGPAEISLLSGARGCRNRWSRSL